MFKKLNFKKIFILGVIFLILVDAFVATMYVVNTNKINKMLLEQNPELAKAMTYTQVKAGDEATNSNYVKFDAYFLKDLDNDGIAEKIRGTCREIGTESTIYMNLSVNTNGYVKDGKITINGKNFYMQTRIPADDQIKENTISNNTTTIKFNNITNGTNKEVLGSIRSGNYSYSSQIADALANNINNYSQVNEIVFTGTHVEDTTGKETKIEKKVNFNVDWYGKAETRLSAITQSYTLEEYIDKDTENLKLEVNIDSYESYGELLLKKSYIEGTIPAMNECEPINVTIEGTGIKQRYDSKTKKFTAQREATVDGNGTITTNAYSTLKNNRKENSYKLIIEYPKEAYEGLTGNGIEIKIPVKAKYEAYNNPDTEFVNPYITNEAEDIVVAKFSKPHGNVAIFDIQVGERDSYYLHDYIVKKENILNRYNGINVENQTNTKYIVRWDGSTGTQGNTAGMIIKSADKNGTTLNDEFVFTDGTTESIENLTSNIGISFTGANELLGDDGWIKVYNDDTNQLIETFTKETWNIYNEYNYYKYKMPIKHIRVETSKTENQKDISIYNIKQLNDEEIYKKYTEEQFGKIKYIKSYVAGYINGILINATLNNARYEEPLSDATLFITPNVMSTQKTEEHAQIEIRTNRDSKLRTDWKNGIFLLEFPESVLEVNINSIKPSSSNVKILSSELYNENGKSYLKIVTGNEIETTYNINIDAQICPDPRKISDEGTIELYAYNENCENYQYKTADKYDINGNSNKTENIFYTTSTVSFIAPNTLLTAEIVKDYNDKSEITVAPKIANVLKTQRTATMQINITNNYSGAISDIKILGKVPFEGNTYVINGGNLGSNFTAQMSSTGIAVPTEIKNYTTIYYSENASPTKDLTDSKNGWKTSVSDFTKIKSYLIAINNYNMEQSKSYEFTYQVKLPEGLDYNKVAYGHHAVYFNLNTSEGKYAQQTEPNKVGIMISKKYDLDLTKYLKNKDRKVESAMYSIYDEEFNETKTASTNENGQVTFKDLFLERTYTLKEIKSPDNYELNSDEIKFKVIEENNQLKYQLTKGTAKSININTTAEKAKLQISVEDSPKAKVKITKVDKDTNAGISLVTYKITGKGMTDGKYMYTNVSGITEISGIYLNEEYTLQEINADGYYVASTPIKFVVTGTENYAVNIKSGTVKTKEVTLENDLPVVNFKIENTKVPQYQLQITKRASNKDKVLANAFFRLQGEEIDEIITTDENGVITLNGLYAYETNNYGVTGEYTLQELYAPNGYIANKETIKFRVDKTSTGYKVNILSGKVNKNSVENNVVKFEITNDPIFRIVKKDGDTAELIPNVKFAIYKCNVDEANSEVLTAALDSSGNTVGQKEIINGTEYQIITTDENGEINLDLATGTYKIIEVETLEKYILPENEEDRTYYIAVGNTDIQGYGNVKKISENIIRTNGGYNTWIPQVLKLENGYVLIKTFNENDIIESKDTTEKKDIKIKKTDTYIVKYNQDDKIETLCGLGTETSSYYSSNILGMGYANNKIIVYQLSSINFPAENVANNTEIIYSTQALYCITFNLNLKVEKVEDSGLRYETQYNYIYNYDRVTGSSVSSVCATDDGGYVAAFLLDVNSSSDSFFIDASVTKMNERININIQEKNSHIGLILKYDANGKIEKYQTLKSNGTGSYLKAEISNMKKTPDGGYIISGAQRYNGFYFSEEQTVNGSAIETFIPESGGSSTPIIIKLNENLKVEWTQGLQSAYGATYNDIYVEENGDIIAVGMIGGKKSTISSENTVNGEEIEIPVSNSYYRGVITKHRSDGKIYWAKSLTGHYQYSNSETITNTSLSICHSIIEKTKDNEYIIYSARSDWYSNDYILEVDAEYCANNKVVKVKMSSKFALLIQIDGNGMVTSAKSINNIEAGSSGDGRRDTFFLTDDNAYMVGTGTNNILYKYQLNLTQVIEKAEIQIENKQKEYKITTDIKEIDNIKGGTISGEDEEPYEIIVHGESSTKEIKMVPDQNYEIIGITINGQDWKYTANNDGSYTMPAFTNVKEDKHIIVTYSLKDNKIIINKEDKDTKEKLSGATFKLDQLEDRSEPNKAEIIGTLTDNGQEYVEANIDKEVTGKLGALTSNGTYYFVQNDNGTYTPTNSKTYQTGNGGTAGISNSTANSYIPIDLTGLTGQYAIVVNASCSSESRYDFGYVNITESTTAPSYNSTIGRVVCISGTESEENYTSSSLNGGKTYYLHLGYRKNGGGDTNDDQIVINSIKLYNTITKATTYNFTNQNGKYESTNAGKHSTVSNSYIPIDLTKCTRKYNLTVNAEISSESSFDYGYVTITENTTRPKYNVSTGRFVYISGTQTAKDYTTVLEAGKKYYLHLGYFKDEATSSGDDKFTVNSVSISLNDSDLYHTTVETNSEGQAITQIPFGKYRITETKAPEGYLLNETATIVEFRSTTGATHEFTIENEAKEKDKGKIIVHHYIKGTTEKLAEDEKTEGTVGNKYTTIPLIDLDNYELEKDTNGQYILPANASGTYKLGTTEVTYYYVEKKIPLTVHHYIEGSTTQVPLKAGGTATDVSGSGKTGEQYTTSAISNDKLSDEYELVAVPSNANGTYNGDEIIVTYYYKKIERKVNLIKYKEDGKTPLEGAKFKINGVNYTTNSEGKITTTLNAGTYDVTEIEAPTNYKIPSNPTTKLTITRNTTEETVNITNEKKTGTVTVHHYIQGTTTKVPLSNGGTAADENKSGKVGEIYATKMVENLSAGYELATEPTNASGTYIDGNIEVIYYYKTIPTSVLVHHYLEGTTTKLANDVTITGIVGDNYTTGVANVENKYEVVAIPTNANGKMTREQIVVTYYYRLKNTSVIVHHYKEGTSEKLSEDVTITGKVDDKYTTTKATDIPSKYELVKTPTNATGTMTVAQTVVTYYYRLKSTGVDVHYYLEGTTTKLSEDVTIEGKVDDKYTTKPATDIASKYELVETPANATGTMTEGRITVIYYYSLKDTSILIHHYLEGTTTKLASDIKINGKVDDRYKTSASTDLLAGKYELVAEPENKNGIMTEAQIVIIYYYRVKSTSVLVHHYIQGTTTKLSKDVIIEGKIDDKYTTTQAKDILAQYELVGTPANASGTMTEAQIVVTYYYQLKNYPYTVNYLEKDTGKVLHTAKQGEELVYGSTVKASDEVISIIGYKYDSVDKENLTIGIANNVINIYYTKRTDLSYKVNYLEKTSNKVLQAQKVQGGMTYQSTVTSANEVIEIDGYNYDSVDKETLTITTGENVINIYYTKRTDLNYKVNYLEKDTNKVLHAQKTQGGMTFGTIITSNKEIIDIDGYNYDSVDQNSIAIGTGENIINIYYTKRTDLSYKVNYLEKTSNKVLHTQKTKGGMTLQSTVTSASEVIAIDGYNYDSVDKETLTITTGENIINIYYTKRTDLSYKVNYLEKTSNKVLHVQKTKGEMTFQSTVTSANEVIAIDGYNYDSVDKNTLTITTGENVINIYYTKRTDLSYKVNYLEKNSDKVLRAQKTKDGMTFQSTVTSANEVIEIDGYNYDSVDKETLTITTGENVINIYYTKRTDLSYKVNYLEKTSNKVLSKQKTQGNMTFQSTVTSASEVIDIDGYNYDSVDKESLTITTGENVINIYYTKRTDLSYKVNYLEKTSNKILHAQKVQNNMTFQSIVTSADEVISIDGYNYDSVDKESLTITTGENIINIYYTKRTDLSYKVNYLEKTSNKVLHKQKTQGNMTFQSTVTSADEVIEIDGYNYDSVDKETITITTGENVINVYYTKREDLTYKVNYLEKDTDKILNEQKVAQNITFESKITSADEVIDIDGYDYDSVDKETLTITTGENIINIYYTKRTDLSYKVNYLEKGTGKVLHKQKTQGGMTFQSTVTSVNEVITIDGYNYDSVDKNTLTITTGENVINIYYTKRTDLSYKVNYLEKDTDKILHAQKVAQNITFESKITSADEVIDIDGYDYDSVDKDELIITTGENVINIYYTKRTDLSYKVNYLEKDTDKVLHKQKTQGEMTFQSTVTSADEVISIDGYNYDSVDKESLTITTGENIINIYYTKRTDLTYKVNYLEKGTDKILHDKKVQNGMTFESVIRSADEIINIYGYKYDSADKETLTITTGENVINIYYTKKDTKVIVHYYEENSENKVSEDVEIPGKVFDDYITKSADDIPSKYELIAEPENKNGTMTEEEIIVIYYYRKKATKVIVHHYEEETTNKLSEDVIINGRVDDPYTTSPADDIPIKYELSVEPENKQGNMTEATIELIYYYRVKDAVVHVRYLEKVTDIQLAEQDRLDGKVDEPYQTTPKDIEGYQLVEHTGNEKGKYEVEPLTIMYYYLYKTKATVQYIDKITGEILEESTTNGLEGDDFVTESKNFENYVLVEEPEEKTIKMTKEEQILKYYYLHISGGVIEKHIDIMSNEILANDSHEGNEGDPYNIPSKIFEGYDLVEERLPENAEGTMKIEPIEVIYYYIYKTEVTAEYIDKNTGNNLAEMEIQKGHEGDEYTTERKVFDDYKLVEVPANADGKMTKEPIKVIYYYVHTSGGVIVNHVDIKTDKQLLDETKEEGYEGDPYETHEENIEGYDLVKEAYPENATGKMTIEPTRVTYYYIKKTEVNVKYVDKETGEEITELTNIPGHQDDYYETEPKELSGYDLSEEPENKEGTMEAEPIEVIYYYRRPAKVIVNYYDIDTKEKLEEEIEILGHQNDEYTTEQKEITYYEIAEIPENKEGKMIVTVTKDENEEEIVEDTTYVNYYYRKLIFNLKVEKTITNVIVNGQETPINGTLGKVEIHRKDISTANVKVVYNIKVTNDSELIGKASITENLPAGMTMVSDKHPDWTIKNTTARLETDDIKPGESRDYQVILEWQNGDENVGTKENVASIITENEAGYEEQFETDNISKANLIVAVGTGEVPYIKIASGVLIIIIAMTVGIFAIMKKEE